MSFGYKDGYGWRAGVPWVVELVAAGCHLKSVGLFFLGTDVADRVGLGDDAPLGYLELFIEENRADAFDAVLRSAIGTDAMR